MRHFVVLVLSLTACFTLAATARADAIGVGGMLVIGALRLVPYLLVAAVVIVTVLLLRKFKRK